MLIEPLTRHDSYPRGRGPSVRRENGLFSGFQGCNFFKSVLIRNITAIAVYNHNADTYGQNIHACVNLRRILGLGQVARVFWGLTQPPKLRATAGLPC